MAKAAKTSRNGGIEVRFRGVRGSYPVSGEGYLQYGGSTSCVEVLAGGTQVVFDMGTGIIPLGEELLREHVRSLRAGRTPKPIEMVILLTHAHHDHIQGFPFFKPAYLDTSVLHIFGPRMLGVEWEDIMKRSMTAPLFPVDLSDMHSHQVIRTIDESEAIILRPGKPPETANLQRRQVRIPTDAVVVRCMRNFAHPKGGVINFRVTYRGKSLVHATDVEGYIGGDARLIAFSKGADMLIHDAQYLPAEYCGLPVPTQGFGHSTFEMAAEVARAAKVKSLALFHHDPAHTDKEIGEIEKKAKKLFPGAFSAREGQSVSL